jgi:hypothetical protein
VEENSSTTLRGRSANPLIVTFIITVVVFVTPAIMTYHEFYQIYTSITWVIRIEQDEPLRVHLTLERVFAFGFIFKYLFLIMVYRYYRNESTFLRTFGVGVFSEVYLYVSSNFGSILYTIFPIPGLHPNIWSDIPLPFSILIFLIMAKFAPCPKSEQCVPMETWLEKTSQ